MNKIVRIKSMRDENALHFNYNYTYGHLAAIFDCEYEVIAIDKILFESYGLRLYNEYDYKIVDEAKFAMFMLKYPQFIKHITDENS
jgi:hypothetical protein